MVTAHPLPLRISVRCSVVSRYRRYGTHGTWGYTTGLEYTYVHDAKPVPGEYFDGVEKTGGRQMEVVIDLDLESAPAQARLNELPKNDKARSP